jgi:ABC-2 type transport system permease protein
VISFKRLYALLRKEWIQVTRDAITLRFIIALPIMQLFLFGYAINTNPQHLPTGLLSVEHSKYERTIIAALRNSGYYDIRTLPSEVEAERALAQGDVMFVIAFPPNFDRSVDRGERPSVLIDADATDPSAIGNATAALATVTAALDRDLPPVMRATPTAPAFQFVIHARYNPEQLTVLNIVPGLICIVLVMSTRPTLSPSYGRSRCSWWRWWRSRCGAIARRWSDVHVPLSNPSRPRRKDSATLPAAIAARMPAIHSSLSRPCTSFALTR